METTLGDAPSGAQPVASVESEDPYLLVIEVQQAHTRPSRDLFGRCEIGVSCCARAQQGAPPELEPCRDARSLDEPDPRHLGQHVSPLARETHEATGVLDEIGGNAKDVTPFFSRPEEDRDELGIREAVEAFANPTLARHRHQH